MRRFIKKEVLSEAWTAEKLVKLDVTDKSMHVNYKKIDIGFLTEKAVKDCWSKWKVSFGIHTAVKDLSDRTATETFDQMSCLVFFSKKSECTESQVNAF